MRVKKKVAMDILDKAFKKAPRNYIVQSILAVVTIAVILYFVQVITHAAIVAALGSSAFIVFAMPNSVTAQPRRLIGGHIVGLLSGVFCYYVFLAGPIGKVVNGSQFTVLFIYALAVGLSIFFMAITNTEHPPAAGTALGMVAHEWSNDVVVFILLFAIGLAIARRLLGSRLKDLVH